MFDEERYFVDEWQSKRFEELCKRYDNSTLLLPKHLARDETNIDGYLTDYYKGYTFIYEIKLDIVVIHEVFSQKRIFIRTYDRRKR